MSDLDRLLGFGLVLLVALGASWLLLALGRRPAEERGGLLPGYPPNLFPVREALAHEPLLALAAIQSRLLSMYAYVPAQSDGGIWLRAFLGELREIMDTTYRVVVITDLYGLPPQLDRLVGEIGQIETQVVAEVTRRLLAREGDTQSELLEGRLETLRLCVRELAGLSQAAPEPS